jgi:hypothetical protein
VLIGRCDAFSGIGVESGTPYTAAVDENTIRFTPVRTIASRSATPPTMFSR